MARSKWPGYLAPLGALALVACTQTEPEASARDAAATARLPMTEKVVSINGAGATFPFPLYSKWVTAYNQLRPNIKINYQSIGSGGAIRQMMAGTVDFGATDVPMTDGEASRAPRKILHIPTALGAVAITYHLAGIREPLRLTPEVLSKIYLGKITKWNASEISRENPNVDLPSTHIAVVFRSDGSGTTAIFTEYLAKVSPEFKSQVGQGKMVKWPVGLGGKGNEGVTGLVKATPNSIGYVERVYATQNDLQVARVRNASGSFVLPSIESTTAAAAGVVLPGELHASVVDAGGAEAYPVSSFTYLLVFEDAIHPKKGQALAEFLWWAMHDGQKECEPLGYAPLPVEVAGQVEERLKQLRIGDKQALSIP